MSHCQYTPQIATMARAGPGQNQKLGPQSKPPTPMAGTQLLEPSRAALQGVYEHKAAIRQGAGT